MKHNRRRRCLACGKLYRPDRRNAYHQHYCSKEECQTASHQASQARWLRQKANRNYYRGPDACERVQAWRAKHPGYWRKNRALQDVLNAQNVAVDVDTSQLAPQESALQDVFLAQHPLFVGLVSILTDALQDDMAPVLRRLHTRGQAILGKGSQYAEKGVCTHDGS